MENGLLSSEWDAAMRKLKATDVNQSTLIELNLSYLHITVHLIKFHCKEHRIDIATSG